MTPQMDTLLFGETQTHVSIKEPLTELKLLLRKFTENTHKHTHTQTQTHTNKHTHTHKHKHTQTHTHKHTHSHPHTRTHTHTHTDHQTPVKCNYLSTCLIASSSFVL